MSNREYIGNYTIVCSHCGAKFRSNRTTAKYCSQSCKSKAHRQAHRNDKVVVARPHEKRVSVKVVEVEPKPKPIRRQVCLTGVPKNTPPSQLILSALIVGAVAITAVCLKK